MAGLVFAIAPTSALASGITVDYIVGQWTDPVLSGFLTDGANRAIHTWYDDSGTAVYSITNASTTGGYAAVSTITEGANASPPAGVSPTSSLVFTGGLIPADHGSVPFEIGGISYTNGTSSGGTGIFGATLDLYASDGASVQFIGSEFVSFDATTNDGTAVQNADYITFSGLAGQSFEVYEGATATGALNGLVIGDPSTTLTSLTLDPGQSPNGFIGSDPPLPTSPEPASLALAGIGLFACGMLRRRMM